MRVLNFITFYLLLLLSCNTSYDPSNEISVALEINGEGNNGEVLGISSNIYKRDSQTVQLELKFNL